MLQGEGNMAIQPADLPVSPDARTGPSRGSLPKLVSVDWLRGLAATVVVVHHAAAFFYRGTVNDSWIAYLLSQGSLGVSVFFVISGFCIHLPHVGAQRLDRKAFLIRRFWRLYPTYILIAMITLLLSGLYYHERVNVYDQLWFGAGHLFFWYYWDQGRSVGMGVTPVLWTIAVEVYFYLIYLFAFRLLIRVGIGRAALVVLSADFVYRLLAPFESAGTFAGIPLNVALNPERFALTRFGEWLLGAWLAEELLNGRLSSIRSYPATGDVMAGIALLLFGYIAAFLPLTAPWGQRLLSMVACIATAWALRGMMRSECSSSRTPDLLTRNSQVGRWLAERSYSLYLVHFTVISGFGVVAAKVMNIADKNMMGGKPVWLGVTMLGFVASFAAADVIYRLIECPSHRLARRLAAAV